LLRNPNRGGQGPNWAVEPCDDNDDVIIYRIIDDHFTAKILEMSVVD
jgi:hypothetical protein